MTEKASRLALLDRDGTINVERRYLSSPGEIEFYARAADGIKLLKNLGLRVVVITNQSAIGRGVFDAARLAEIHERFGELLLEAGTSVDAIYFCPHAPEDDCRCRKPSAEMAKRAARDFNADLSKSFVVGDKACDIEMGKNVGATTVLVRTGYGAQAEREEKIKPDYAVENLFEAARLIKGILENETE